MFDGINTQDSGNNICQASIKYGTPRISLYGKKCELIEYITSRKGYEHIKDKFDRINVKLPIDIYDKYTVPINYNLNTKLRWLEGLLDGDGTVIKSCGNITAIQLASIKLDFLQNVRYLLQTIGCDCKITTGSNESFRKLPNGKGDFDEFYCQKTYRLLISSYYTAKLYNLGFRPKRLQISGIYPIKNAKRWVTVKSVIEIPNSPTYCVNEPKKHKAVFNGHLTGQCSEICIYSDENEYGTCNLCSIALPKFVKNGEIDYELLKNVSEKTVFAMNRVIDNSYYPVPEAQRSNIRHRPLGIGVQGLADVYMMLKLPFDSEQAAQINKQIFETIYYGTLKSSMELAKIHGPYETFKGSPMSFGKFQFDLVKEHDNINVELSGKWDWESLRNDIIKHGIRNCYLTALMPTASTAQIMGNSECFECIDSCIFKRRVLSGEYIIVNKNLVKELINLKLWSSEMRDTIIANNGSIQNIQEIPDNIKQVYKTVWEISMKSVINQARDRGAFIDQMQSMNLFMANPNNMKLSSMHLYAWKQNLKTGCYYLRSKAIASAAKFSLNVETEQKIKNASQQVTQGLYNTTEDQDECLACSS